MVQLLSTLYLVIVCCIKCNALNFTLSQTPMPPQSRDPAAGIYQDKLVLIYGFPNDFVYAINVSLLLMPNNNFDSWQFIRNESTIKAPFKAKAIQYVAESFAQFDNTVYGIPIFRNEQDHTETGDKLFQFDLMSRQYVPKYDYDFTILEKATSSCLVMIESTQKLYIIGSATDSFYPLDDTQEYDINTDSWTQLDNLNIASYRAGCASSNDDEYIYYFGGLIEPETTFDSSTTYGLDDIQRYDINGDSWSTLSEKLHVARYAHSCELFDHYFIYCIAGRNNNWSALRSVEIFDINQEKILDDMIYINDKRLDPITVVYDNILFVMDGYRGDLKNITSIEYLIGTYTTTSTPTTTTTTTDGPTTGAPAGSTTQSATTEALTTETPTTETPTTETTTTTEPTHESASTMDTVDTTNRPSTVETLSSWDTTIDPSAIATSGTIPQFINCVRF